MRDSGFAANFFFFISELNHQATLCGTLSRNVKNHINEAMIQGNTYFYILRFSVPSASILLWVHRSVGTIFAPQYCRIRPVITVTNAIVTPHLFIKAYWQEWKSFFSPPSSPNSLAHLRPGSSAQKWRKRWSSGSVLGPSPIDLLQLWANLCSLMDAITPCVHSSEEALSGWQS